MEAGLVFHGALEQTLELLLELVFVGPTPSNTVFCDRPAALLSPTPSTSINAEKRVSTCDESCDGLSYSYSTTLAPSPLKASFVSLISDWVIVSSVARGP